MPSSDRLPITTRIAQWRSLLIVGGIALAVLVFIRLASEMVEGDTRAFDAHLLTALRRTGDLADPIGPAWLKLAMLDLTALGGTAVLSLITLLALGLVAIERNWQRAAYIGVAVGGGSLLSGLLKLDYARPRPTIVAHLVDVSSASFPSGHAMNSAIVYLTLGLLCARAVSDFRAKAYVVAVAITLTLIVGVTRVYLGVHWPTDVLGGWAAGAAWAVLCWTVVDTLERRSGVPD